ncbi:MAG: hypothetical protein DRR08_10915 [Candidatus Parabeggiatoa sp. nov. 2]|nr:MAG: hypothetical protein B6247_12215 [Beggiatoa sp. 4572_84]RKZ60596.1 MAG: hypothetical protein DRR08_10915 [Gammaproteobacteria bacterium]HEC86217.1 hypothetical protein [Thioploca sp.]
MLISNYKSVSVLIMLAFLLGSCATPPLLPQLTYSNFTKIQEGVTTEEEVINLLGEPTEVKSGSFDISQIGSALGLDKLLGLDKSDKPLSGTTAIWKTAKAQANVIFYKGKVLSKRFTKK